MKNLAVTVTVFSFGVLGVLVTLMLLEAGQVAAANRSNLVKELERLICHVVGQQGEDNQLERRRRSRRRDQGYPE